VDDEDEKFYRERRHLLMYEMGYLCSIHTRTGEITLFPPLPRDRPPLDRKYMQRRWRELTGYPHERAARRAQKNADKEEEGG
jgi:hypothetical protein